MTTETVQKSDNTFTSVEANKVTIQHKVSEPCMISRRDFLKAGLTTALGVALPGLLSRSNRSPLPSKLLIASRASWGAAEPDHDAEGERGLYDPQDNPGGWRVYDAPLVDILHTIVVHHTATFVKQMPRQVQNWHIRKAKLADIAYHFVITDRGHIFEGRAINVRGAHTGGHNTGTVGVALLGHFDLWHPQEAQLAALRLLIPYLKECYAITHIAGHRDFQPGVTHCPGDHLAAHLPDLASEHSLIYSTGGQKAWTT